MRPAHCYPTMLLNNLPQIYFDSLQLECKIYFASLQLECKIYFACSQIFHPDFVLCFLSLWWDRLAQGASLTHPTF
ncbi:MAG: hypothetical protein DRR16_23925 [Candidatus Parabeggiatoa sp. nov. 3]|nr:MAG: hypothetical protein DRR00_09510 [Gammaproteobacteria bacterium]RKZ67951.1 MAG: hypothetical protein DRQ99_05300 [Gammaproteobacteria bacterium]RKZ80391.1 MAG: hypothetical protein DRR16_23925 [Gammaproteobacteria bacterium]